MPIYLIRPKLGYSNTYLYANITIFMQFGKCRHLNPQSFSHEQVAQTIWQSDRWLTNNMFMFRFDKSFFRNATYLVSLNLLIHNVIKVINQSLSQTESDMNREFWRAYFPIQWASTSKETVTHLYFYFVLFLLQEILHSTLFWRDSQIRASSSR